MRLCPRIPSCHCVRPRRGIRTARRQVGQGELALKLVVRRRLVDGNLDDRLAVAGLGQLHQHGAAGLQRPEHAKTDRQDRQVLTGIEERLEFEMAESRLVDRLASLRFRLLVVDIATAIASRAPR